MSIIIDTQTRVVIQGITGNVGQAFAKKMIEDGTPLVSGVTPNKGGEKVFDVPVFDSIKEAIQFTNPNFSLIVVPPPYLKDAIFEALYNGLKKIVIYTENMPLHDEIEVVYYAHIKDALLLGPNSIGIAAPNIANISDFNSKYLRQGNIGIISKSGTLTYEVIEIIIDAGLGISTFIGIGGDPIIGTTYLDILPKFESDPETKGIVIIGEIGGKNEIEAIPFIKKMSKPVFAYIAGQFVPQGKKMGHAGAIISQTRDDSALYKMEILKQAGVQVANVITDLSDLLICEYKG